MRAPTLFIGFVVVAGCASPEQSTEQAHILDGEDIGHAAGPGAPDLQDVIELPDASGVSTDLSMKPGPNDLAQHHDLSLPVHDMAQPIHDMAMPVCNPEGLSIGAYGGQDICPYGDYCEFSPDQCIAAPVGSCGATSGAPTWDTASKLAPVIMSATVTGLASTNSSTECANGDPAALVTINYYAATPLSTSLATLESEVKWKKSTSAAGSWYSGTFVREYPSTNAHVGQIQIGMNCGATTGTLAVYLDDSGGHTSNVVCVTW